MHVLRRAGVAAAILLTAVGVSIGGAGSANAQETNSCNGVFRGEGDDGTLTKEITGVTDNEDGTFTIAFEFTTTRADGTYRLRDCAFVDDDDNGAFDRGEELLAADDDRDFMVTDGAGSSEVTVEAESGTVVCDRLALSGREAGTSFTDKSNTACVTLGTTPIPVGTVGGAGLLLLAAGAFGYAYRRSTRTGDASA